MFEDPFRLESIASLTTPSKQLPKRPKSPPKSCQEWLASQESSPFHHHVAVPEEGGASANDPTSWPKRAPEGEQLLDGALESHGILGTLDSIKEDIQRHAPWDPYFLESIDRRLKAVEKSLDHYADCFVVQSVEQESVAGGLKNIRNIAFLTEMCDKDLLEAVRSRSTKTPRNRAAQAGENEKGVEDVIFPDLKHLEENVVPLPGQVEALSILDLVTKVNTFPQYSVKAWRRIFYSEDTISIFQNTFWWIWMDQFNPDPFHQSVLFDYVSESFASLMISMSDVKHKDEVFMHYPGCLAQAVYSAFCNAFPKSKHMLNSSDFLDYITDLTSEWIAGVKCAPGSWEKWPRHLLNPYHATTQRPATEIGQSSLASGRPVLTEKDVMQLSLANKRASGGRTTASGQGRSSRVQFSHVGQRSARTRGRGIGSALPVTGSTERSLLTREISVVSQPTTPGQDRDTESHSDVQVGPGPIFECVRFSTLGRSPLLQHYLYRHNLTELQVLHHHPISRTQIKDIPPPTFTYKQLLQTSNDRTDQWYRTYERDMGESAQTITEAHKRYVANMRAAERRNKRVLQHRFEVAILAEKLVGTKKEQRLKEMAQLFSKDSAPKRRPRSSSSTAREQSSN